MKKFEYEISISSPSQSEADRKMKALTQLAGKLSAVELEKIAGVVSNPMQLALIKAKLGI